MNVIHCPTADELRLFLRGELAAEQEQAVDSHITTCTHCEAMLAKMRPNDTADKHDTDVKQINRETTVQFAPPRVPGDLGQFGKYRIMRELGRGGMGAVYLAFDDKLQRKVAIKLMNAQLASNALARERFLREARAVARISSERVIGIFEAEEIDQIPYIAMPFLQGTTLQAKLEPPRQLSVADVIRYGRDIALGLADAHTNGIIHRDIKPSNIWLEPTNCQIERVRLLDFGLARGDETTSEQQTASGMVVGTPAYMSPEQGRGEAIDHRADLWSLGVVLYEMAVGHRPFQAKTALGTLTKIATEQPPSPRSMHRQIPQALSELIMQLLAKNPADRPPTATNIAERLLAIQLQHATPTIEALPAEPIPQAMPVNSTDLWSEIDTVAAEVPKPKRTAWLLWAVMLVIGSGLLTAIGFGVYKVIIETKEGTLIVEVEPSVDIRFNNGKLEIRDDVGRLMYTLTPSEAKKPMPPGKYRVNVAGIDGLMLSTDEFKITKGENTLIRVYAQPTMPGKKPIAITSKDPDREAAELILSKGGVVRVNDTKSPLIQRITDLPKQPFILKTISFEKVDLRQVDLSIIGQSRGITSITINNCQLTDNQFSQIIANKPKLTALLLFSNQLTNSGLIHTNDYHNILYLYLADNQITDAGLSVFNQCTEIKILSLSKLKVTHQALETFANCKQLFRLHIDGTLIGDEAIERIYTWKELIDLNLTGAKFTKEGINKLAERLPSMRILADGYLIPPRISPLSEYSMATHFHASGGKVFMDYSGSPILQAKDIKPDMKLTRFDASNYIALKPNDYCYLNACSYLETVELGSTIATDQVFEWLGNSPNLKHLSVHKTKITDAGLKKFPQLKKLLSLDIHGTAITDDGLKALQNATALNTLNLYSNKITDVGIAHLSQLTELQELDLGLCQISDMGVKQLKDLRKLKNLNLAGTKISDDVLPTLLNFNNLQTINVSNTKLSQDAIIKLKQAFPQLKVEQ